jgi:hypothetical protein
VVLVLFDGLDTGMYRGYETRVIFDGLGKFASKDEQIFEFSAYGRSLQMIQLQCDTHQSL